MLQCVASVLQCVSVCCSVLQCVILAVEASPPCDRWSGRVCCSVLQCVAVCRRMLQYVAVCCSVLQCVAVCCSVLQCATLSAGTSRHIIAGEKQHFSTE